MSEANVTENTKVKAVQKRRRGYVVSDKMDKTIVVEVEDVSPTPCTARSCVPPSV